MKELVPMKRNALLPFAVFLPRTFLMPAQRQRNLFVVLALAFRIPAPTNPHFSQIRRVGQANDTYRWVGARVNCSIETNRACRHLRRPTNALRELDPPYVRNVG